MLIGQGVQVTLINSRSQMILVHFTKYCSLFTQIVNQTVLPSFSLSQVLETEEETDSIIRKIRENKCYKKNHQEDVAQRLCGSEGTGGVLAKATSITPLVIILIRTLHRRMKHHEV